LYQWRCLSEFSVASIASACIDDEDPAPYGKKQMRNEKKVKREEETETWLIFDALLCPSLPRLRVAHDTSKKE
jgi:hypothetical protein